MIHQKIVIEPKTQEYDEAYMMTYFWEESWELYPGQKRPVILICPGGAYRMTSDREAEAIAVKFMSMGYHTAVLRYSVPAEFPAGLLQLARAVKILKERSREWLIEKDKVLVMGFSAGGHLAASLGVFWNREELSRAVGTTCEAVRPAGLLLSYPVITTGEYGHQDSIRNLLGKQYEERKEQMSLEDQVSPQTPRAFMWHNFDDGVVPVENSLLFARAMVKNGVPVELHIFPEGNHGIGLATKLTADADGRRVVDGCDSWSELAENWLNREFPWFTPKK